jgi:mannose-6-phosphate isomerase-like protein (cupin superfamily)
MSSLPFPGAVGITYLRVYETETPDGLHGGSPHVHLLSAEAYIPIAGSGEVHTISREGFRKYPLEPGGIVWFEPGVIHRLVNTTGNLELLVIMQNAGLPESGDAIFTFPREVMESTEAYGSASTLPKGSLERQLNAARARRDLAIEGFIELIAEPNPKQALEQFYAHAIRQRQDRFERWSQLIAQGPVEESHRTQQRLVALTEGATTLLGEAKSTSTGSGEKVPVVGMCGLLRQFEPMEG